MLDIKYIREKAEELKQNIFNRHLDPKVCDVDKLLLLDARKIQLDQELDKLREARNRLADQLKDEKARTPQLIEEGKKIKDGIKVLEEELSGVLKDWQNLMDWMPNITSPLMPIGEDSSGNIEFKVWPEKNPRPKFKFEPKHYHDLMVNLDLVDMEKAAKNSGTRFYYLKNETVLLQFALFNHAIQKLVKKGFTPITTPDLVRYRPLYGTGYFPSESSAIYKMFDEDKMEEKEALYLVGTSEQAIVAYHADEVLDLDDDHPLRYVGYSECFRSEAGSWGKDTKGIKRVHQFSKVEMIYFTTPETSEKYMHEALTIEEEILQDLGLPYHVIDMCSGDVGMATYRKYDTEVWLPSQQEYCETMSNSDLAAYHSHRLNIKFHDKKTGEKRYVHTISATAITNTRPILAIVDNNQNPDGSVTIPETLREYVGKEKITPKS
ncbi:MAG: Serine-tRNA ligase [Microgenomates group bacterium GW2011_GWA1_48_10]|uniref:Serine--tRNA ligase n=1 Tax=Candidatus Gottesmanbacteria bacterium RIFCSPHIGHO2_01_FULL_47_48 TaxID=1798381 RepID=A0A1F6A2Z6_9BACT|nr:MAG: Serine-tRNA ligase [Microgenomates group bacterium GW2011_GWA1_48_10]OGG19068.1 MAG: serine--tRNA ligase [Candidatus Gottesmanbacteria bacterium RIFCSPHIGHO2_01_FULL_47_48]